MVLYLNLLVLPVAIDNGDPISPYLFIITAQIINLIIVKTVEIKRSLGKTMNSKKNPNLQMIPHSSQMAPVNL